ncbi:glycoside hydrolase [Algoriphagus ratkowskyi]|nr:glycoside hydrolase [Algoriphagus ratkowskyi]TXD77144.1 xylanase [Algoriphagus ratkowskyi]
MYKNTILFVGIAIFLTLKVNAQVKPVDLSLSETIDIHLLTKDTYQTIEHFGASDAWSAQFVGLWPDQKKNSIAELLFSNENDGAGNPKGIGLSMWRFNIGAGSAEQGAQSGIRDEWRRAESFMNADGSYDWSKQAGQVWFAKAAKKYGVANLLVFANSPPVSMTDTGQAYAILGRSNLKSDHYNAYGEYLAQVIKGLGEKGLNIDYVSPVNEPQWDWSDRGQEGTPFFNAEIAEIVKALDDALEKNKLETKIDIAEAGKINYLYEQADKSGRGEQITDFFQPESFNYIGDLKHVSKSISAHSYFSTSPFASAISQRESLRTALNTIEGLGYWMSEYCILGDNAGEIKGNGRDLGIDPALYIAKVIHNDLTISNASAWHWWIALSPYDYKDGLIYIDKNKEDGDFYESKMLWGLGNFSRFVRPGYKRVGVELNNSKYQSPEFLVSAYQSADQREVVMIVVNSEIGDLKVSLTGDNSSYTMKRLYITSQNKSLEFVDVGTSGNSVVIPARSIVTVILEK